MPSASLTTRNSFLTSHDRTENNEVEGILEISSSQNRNPQHIAAMQCARNLPENKINHPNEPTDGLHTPNQETKPAFLTISFRKLPAAPKFIFKTTERGFGVSAVDPMRSRMLKSRVRNKMSPFSFALQ